MTKKNTKRALMLSCLSLLLCVTMLVGSTFAWFTDTVSVVGNKIVAGTLDIELWETSYNDWMDQPDEEGFVEKNITDSKEPIFNSELWEPGYLAYTNLTVKNVGSLAAKIQAYMVPTGEIGKLAEVIDVYVAHVPFADNYDSYTIREFFNGEYVLPWGGGMNMFNNYVTHVGTLKDVMEQGIDLAVFTEGEDTEIEAGENYQINIALKMQESAGNEYQGQPAGEFDIRILATQATVEEDYYDDQYDKDAEYPQFYKGEVITEGTVEGIFNNGGYMDFQGAVVDGTDNSYFQDGSKVANLTFNSNSQGNAVRYAYIYGDVTFTNCEFNANGGYAFHVDDVVGDATDAVITFENCSFNDWIAVSSDVAELKFVNCTFTDAAFVNSRQDATFENCTFTSAFTMDDELDGEQTWTFTGCTGLVKENLNLTGSKSDVKIVIN